MHEREAPQEVNSCACVPKSTYISTRNEQRKAKKARHEREKGYMEVLQALGNTVGEYAGDGQGEAEADSAGDVVADLDDIGADSGIDDLSMEHSEGSSDDAQPLLFLYDCETTGLSIYNDHIIEIAAELVNCPVTYSCETFSSLVKTSRRIPAPGNHEKAWGE